MCPRCELNYIRAKEKYCTVCKAELGMIDSAILLPDDEEAGLERLCPVCHVNYIGEDEEVCFLCQKEREERESAHKNDEWEAEETEEEKGQTPIGLIPLEDDDALLSSADDEPEEEEEQEPAQPEVDYEFVTAEELDALGDLDDDELDEEDDDEDF